MKLDHTPMSCKIEIPVTHGMFLSWLEYLKECGYSVTKQEEEAGIYNTYFSYDCPYYGKLTPVGFEYKDLMTNRWKRYIFIRLPDENTRRALGGPEDESF